MCLLTLLSAMSTACHHDLEKPSQPPFTASKGAHTKSRDNAQCAMHTGMTGPLIEPRKLPMRPYKRIQQSVDPEIEQNPQEQQCLLSHTMSTIVA